MSKNPELPSHNDSTQSAAGGNDSSYRVGYGHPPKHSQFRPGQSGNPSGRPKRVKNLQAELLEELGELTRIREGDSQLEISKARAIAKSLVRAAVDGNMRAATLLVSFCARTLGDVTNSRSKERPRMSKSSTTSSAVNYGAVPEIPARRIPNSHPKRTTTRSNQMNNEFKSVLRADFLAFARKAIRETEGTKISHDRYLEVVATKLMDFADGKIKRLIVNLPPRHLKTQLGSVCLAAWILAHKPNTKIMVVGYSGELAEEIARSVRSILQADWFKKIFDTRIAKGHAKAKNFATTAGGALYAASIDGSITGFGADVIIGDDLHNITDAGYPEQLERTIERFDTVIMSRLNNRKKGRVIVIAHRIHDMDLSAHLLAGGGWTHVVLPVIATRDQTYDTAYGPWHRRKGTLLQPDADDVDQIEKLRGKLVNPAFDLLYQQDVDGQALPSITADNFPTYSPDDIHNLPHVISVDAATDEGDRRSFSVIQDWAYDRHNRFLVVNFESDATSVTWDE